MAAKSEKKKEEMTGEIEAAPAPRRKPSASTDTIRLFMWGFQRYFQSSLKFRAEELFKALDPGFEVKVFLLGLVRKKSPTNHPVCLEPEECGFEPHTFASVREDARSHLINVARG